MNKFNVVVKNWKTGQVVSTYSSATAEELAKLETEHHAFAPADWDIEVTKA